METFEPGTIHPTSVISSGATLGSRVTVGPFSVIHDGVEIGDDSVIGSHTALGEPTADFYGSDVPTAPRSCVIGHGAVIRSHSIIYQDVTIGSELRTGHRVTIREGSHLGDGVHVGTSCDLQGELAIGDHARLHSGVFVAQHSVIEEFAWLFPHVVITNDPHPPSDTCTVGGSVRRFAVVAAGALLMPGIEVGELALVGARSVVTHDVPPEVVVMGSPAEVTGSVRDVRCRHGALGAVYPWPLHFSRGYAGGVVPSEHLDPT